MTAPGEFRKRARRQATREEKQPPQQRFDSPLEQAIARKLRTLASEEAPKEVDARAIGMLVVKHWGDDAPKVLELATEYVRDEVGRWTPKPPESEPGQDPNPERGGG